MNNQKHISEKLISEVFTYNKVVPFFRFVTACEHTLITDDEISPLATNISGEFGPVAGFGAIYRLIGDGSHTPTFSGIKKSSASGDYDNTEGTVNLIVFLFDGSDYWYSITQEA